MLRMGGRALSLVALLSAVAVYPVSTASAQEWRRGEYEYFKVPHKFGPLCEYRIRARGRRPGQVVWRWPSGA